jgi:hypothetical protein
MSWILLLIKMPYLPSQWKQVVCFWTMHHAALLTTWPRNAKYCSNREGHSSTDFASQAVERFPRLSIMESAHSVCHVHLLVMSMRNGSECGCKAEGSTWNPKGFYFEPKRFLAGTKNSYPMGTAWRQRKYFPMYSKCNLLGTQAIYCTQGNIYSP